VVDSRDILPSYFNESILIRQPSIQQIFECKDWNEQFLDDLSQAKKKVVIFNPFFAQKWEDDLIDAFRFLIDKKVALYVITRPSTQKKKDLVDLQKYLEKVGVKLIYHEKLYEKVAFIDDKVCWFGNSSIFSYNGMSEFMFSIRIKEVIMRLYQFFGVNVLIGPENEQARNSFLWGNLQNDVVQEALSKV
jgi:phosphatidylserine/phosphatidylglycerophosphate/cardiolipin synthase-like enzyme